MGCQLDQRVKDGRMVKITTVRKDQLMKRGKGAIALCPTCHEASPAKDGGICLACRGQSPSVRRGVESPPALALVTVEEAVGKPAVHDMTRIVPGKGKGPAFLRGQEMGRMHLHDHDQEIGADWVHEYEAALDQPAGRDDGDSVFLSTHSQTEPP